MFVVLLPWNLYHTWTQGKEGEVAEWWPRAHNSWSFIPWKVFNFLKIFVTDFSEHKKDRKLKVGINMDNDRMYCVYQIGAKGP